MIEIPRTVVRAIEEHARGTFPEECCGFLLGSANEPRRVEEARPAKNMAVEDRARRYVIDPLELLHADEEARARHLDLIGIYHSHPNHPAVPSEFDRARAASWYSYVILGIRDRRPGDVTAWRFDESSRRFESEEILIRSDRLRSRKRSVAGRG